MSKLKEQAEKVLVVFTLFLSESALIPVLLESGDGSVGSDPLSPLLFMAVYVIIVFQIALQWKSFVRVAPKNIFIWLVVAMALASVFWTFGPDITPRRSVAMLGSTLFAAYVAMRYTLKEQLQLLAWTFGITIVLSFVFAIALPSYGLMVMQEGGKHAGAWRGVLTHKNLLGRLMSLSGILFLLLAIDSQKHRVVLWTCFALSAILVLLSTSKGALVVFITLLIVLPLYRAWRWSYNWLVPFIITVILVGGVAGLFLIDNAEGLANSMGKDLTLTGRTEIWAISFEMIGQRPLTGYGFSAFWLGWESEASSYMWKILGWECPYAHNGFVDLGLELGVPGLAFFLGSFFLGWLGAITWLRTTRTVDGLWPLIYMTFLVMCNLTEGGLVVSNSIFWMLYAITVFSIAAEFDRAKRLKRTNLYLYEEEWLEMEEANEQNL